jgi:hypothetical protein
MASGHAAECSDPPRPTQSHRFAGGLLTWKERRIFISRQGGRCRAAYISVTRA